MKSDMEKDLKDLEGDVGHKLSDLRNIINLTQRRKDFLLKEALLNLSRISPESYSRLCTVYKNAVPSIAEFQMFKSQEIGCLNALGDITLDPETYLDISEASVVSIWSLKGSYYDIDMYSKLEITKEIEGKETKEYISAINEVEFRPSDPTLHRVAEFLKDTPNCLQMIPSLLLTYKELQEDRENALSSLKERIPRLSFSAGLQEVVLDIPLTSSELATLHWAIAFDPSEFNLENDITVEMEEDNLHLFSRHKCFDILTMKKLLTNANDVLNFVDSFNN